MEANFTALMHCSGGCSSCWPMGIPRKTADRGGFDQLCTFPRARPLNFAYIPPQSSAKGPQSQLEHKTMDRAAVAEKIARIIEPFNKKGVAITDASTFAGDLEFDSLTVMDFVAAIEDEFDIIISMNQQAEIENYGQLIDAVVKLQG